jgi:hypothetical protein
VGLFVMPFLALCRGNPFVLAVFHLRSTDLRPFFSFLFIGECVLRKLKKDIFIDSPSMP